MKAEQGRDFSRQTSTLAESFLFLKKEEIPITQSNNKKNKKTTTSCFHFGQHTECFCQSALFVEIQLRNVCKKNGSFAKESTQVRECTRAETAEWPDQ